MHVILRDKISALGDKSLRAEFSLAKTIAETGKLKESVRIDIFEGYGEGSICVYDLKTGKMGLSEPRSAEFARSLLIYIGLRQVIVTEVRAFE